MQSHDISSIGMGGRSGSTGLGSKNISSIISQREQTNGSTNNLVQAPKVMSNNYKQQQNRIDYSSI
jgi:hypothetical protein